MPGIPAELDRSDPYGRDHEMADPKDFPNPTSEPRSEPYDADTAEALDDIDWGELQDFFFEHLRSQLDQMSGYLAQSDAWNLSRLGHSLKGSGGGVQLPEFTELGRHLETAGKDGDMIAVLSACRAIRDEYLKHRPDRAAEVTGLF
jgi:HPt (histidine-containing phosphotransfer) domain-containing protein